MFFHHIPLHLRFAVNQRAFTKEAGNARVNTISLFEREKREICPDPIGNGIFFVTTKVGIFYEVRSFFSRGVWEAFLEVLPHALLSGAA